MYNNLPAKLKWNALLIKNISVPSPLGKIHYKHSDLRVFFTLTSQLSPLLVNFNMICLEACRCFCWAVFILIRDMKTSLTDSDLRTLQRDPKLKLCAWCSKLALATWNSWGCIWICQLIGCSDQTFHFASWSLENCPTCDINVTN